MSHGEVSRISAPHTLIEPEIGRISPAIVPSKVDFPIPEGPAMATISPGNISRLGILTSDSEFHIRLLHLRGRQSDFLNPYPRTTPKPLVI